MRRRLAFLLQCVLVSAELQAQVPVRFSASVHAGEEYVRPIGHGLYFVVAQMDGGDWDFKIKPSQHSQVSYTDCLGSPVLHGPATVDLTAWRFASGADAGWAEQLPTTKRFDFVTNAADQTYECAESDAIYDSFQRSQSAGQMQNYDGLTDYRARPVGHGRVVISSVSLKSGLSSEDAEFESVVIHVRVTFPKEKRQVRRR